jgi:WD40-like Beta Propeller Repeat
MKCVNHGRSVTRLLPGLLLAVLGLLTGCHLAYPFDVQPREQGLPLTDGPGATLDAAVDSAADAVADAAGDIAGDAAPWSTFGPATPVTEINTSYGEDDPTLTGDMLEIYFERSQEIWCATRTSASAPWSAPAQVAALNSTEENGTPDISVDGLTIFFASRRPGAGVKGGIEIYVASRPSRTAPWEAPVLIPELNTAAEDLCAAPTADLLTVVLDSTRAGGAGARDLFVASRADLKQPWTAPSVLVSVNSSVDDECPWIDAKGDLILFSSDRPGGLAGHDIWYAARGGALAGFSTPALLPGVNSTAADGDPWLSADRKTIYFQSDRSGNCDIYVAQVP